MSFRVSLASLFLMMAYGAASAEQVSLATLKYVCQSPNDYEMIDRALVSGELDTFVARLNSQIQSGSCWTVGLENRASESVKLGSGTKKQVRSHNKRPVREPSSPARIEVAAGNSRSIQQAVPASKARPQKIRRSRRPFIYDLPNAVELDRFPNRHTFRPIR